MSNDFFSTSNRIKSTPFTSRNNMAGVKKYSVYNNTLIPTVFKSLKSDYFHLIKHVQIWDVCCQKVIEVRGNHYSNVELIKKEKKKISRISFLVEDFYKFVDKKSYLKRYLNSLY